MKEFFHGARTKMGLLTLVTACFFLVGWFRSQTRFEYIDVSIGNVSYGVTSMHSGLDFSRTTELDPTTVLDFIDFKSVELFIKPQDPLNGTPWSSGFQFDWRWDWAGFHIGEGHYASRRDQDIMVPYWSLVIPLTLISAWLLLSRPRKTNPKKIADPSANKGATS